MKIKGILQIFNSRRDMYGNCYWAFSYRDAESGKEAVGTISGGESNIAAARYNLVKEGETVYLPLTQELPIRQFDRMTKAWPYAGCTPEDIASFIKKELAKPPGF